jgi:serine/threonine-protein kinase
LISSIDDAPTAGAPDPFSEEFHSEYQPLRLLGPGAFGAVYLMRQKRLDRLVAVKRVRPDVAPQEAERLLKEARVLARVDHPGIVTVHDVRVEDGAPCIVCEHVAGGTLMERLARGPAPTLDEALALTLQILDALDASHAAGIVHRDLKPANILLTPAGRPKIADFGLARSLDGSSGTVSIRIEGTPPYMSPEQCRAQRPTVSTDIYAMGVILYEMTVGCRPFLGPELVDFLRQHAEEAPPPPRSRVPDLPEDLEREMLKALAKDPALRHESAAAFARALATTGRSPAPVSPALAPHPAPRDHRETVREQDRPASALSHSWNEGRASQQPDIPQAPRPHSRAHAAEAEPDAGHVVRGAPGPRLPMPDPRRTWPGPSEPGPVLADVPEPAGWRSIASGLLAFAWQALLLVLLLAVVFEPLNCGSRDRAAPRGSPPGTRSAPAPPPVPRDHSPDRPPPLGPY